MFQWEDCHEVVAGMVDPGKEDQHENDLEFAQHRGGRVSGPGVDANSWHSSLPQGGGALETMALSPLWMRQAPYTSDPSQSKPLAHTHGSLPAIWRVSASWSLAQLCSYFVASEQPLVLSG